jgi:SAM-dependent methyltransferase
MRLTINCRLCGAGLSNKPVLSLAPTPPANEFVHSADVGKKQDVFSLNVFFCEGCGHSQLTTVVDPIRLFGNYVYVSGTSPVFVEHFRKYAEEMIERFSLKTDDLVVDIGSNDGTLLRFFKERGMRVIGIDPAKDIAARATENGIPTLPIFFDQDAVQKILINYGRPSLVVANNVFAHADNLNEITAGISSLIGTTGAFVFEVSYLPDVCSNTLFDTIYHEHLAYHNLLPLSSFFRKHGMHFIDAIRVNTHGGSIRGFITSVNSLRPVSPNVGVLMTEEIRDGFGIADKGLPLLELSKKIEALRLRLTERLHDLKKDGKKIAAFGAPAKATTLMYHFGLDRETIDFVVDDSPLKQGLFTPGKHIPVLPSKAIYELKPDYLLILAWNFAEPIMKNHQAFLEAGGHFIVPIPEYEEY